MTVPQTTFHHQSIGKLKACCLCITTSAFPCLAYESWEKDDLTFHLLRFFSASALKTWMYWPTQNSVDARLVYHGLDMYKHEHLHPGLQWWLDVLRGLYITFVCFDRGLQYRHAGVFVVWKTVLFPRLFVSFYPLWGMCSKFQSCRNLSVVPPRLSSSLSRWLCEARQMDLKCVDGS